jgi:hypothetical protein
MNCWFPVRMYVSLTCGSRSTCSDRGERSDAKSQHQVYLAESDHAPFGKLEPLAVLKTNPDGAGIVRRRLVAAHHILANAGLTDVDTEFVQFTVDAGCTPPGILPAHLADQVSDLAGNERPSRLAAPRPSKSRTSES